VILVASANGDVGMDAAWEILAAGGSALDAVEAGTRLVEDNPDDHTAGYSGYPNLLGQVELDASIMDGTTRRAGAVGALRRNRAAITVARAVMERLPHVLVVGSGADSLAEEIGLPEEDLLTEEAADLWRRGREGNLPPDSVAGRMLSAVARLATDPERAAGTVNFIAVDGDGRIASAVSTSGWAWKHPGRLGDSPVIGAGNYADDRYGAAACTGFGELAIRASTARTVVAGMAAGRPVSAAAVEAMHDLATLGMPPEQAIISLVAVGADGSHVAVSTREGATYVVREEGMGSFEQRDRLLVDLSA
jgi:L-asparaginase / beta-aspartyl-peptidase